MTDLYEILGVPRDASPEEVKSAYRAKAKNGAHPDHGGTTQSFALVKQAYDTLHDRERRKRYDRTGEIDDPQADQIDMRAMSAVFAALAQQVAQADARGLPYASIDLLGGVKASLQGQRQAALKKIEDIKSILKKKETLVPLFHGVDDKPNRLGAMIDAENRKLADLIEISAKDLSVLDRAIEIANEHGFDYDPPQTISSAVFYYSK
jgi:DnaJ-class molecular chaperone